MNTKTLIALALGSALLACPAHLCAAQGSDQEASPTPRERPRPRKRTAPKAKLTIDNDNLGTLTGTVNVVGQQPAPPKIRPRSCRG